MKLILASSSPQRINLLKQVEITPEKIIPADIDETPKKGELPRDYVKRIALEKAEKVFSNNRDYYVLAADTIAALGTRIIGKAENEAEARKFVKLISGRRHKVLSGVCIISSDGKKRIKIVSTIVKFRLMTNEEIENYLGTNEWVGKSGCFAIQGRAGEFIEWINGSFSNVIGLPLYETCQMLKSAGCLKKKH